MEPTAYAKRMSIVVPCYKTERYLPACLDSLMAQTLGDIEVICVNDGSPDGCLDIMRSYESRYADRIVVVDKENGGLMNARWSGIDAARGAYVGFVDSDDHVERTFAEKLYYAINSANASMATCGFRRVDLDTGRELSREMCVARAPFLIEDDPGRIIEVNPAVWNKVYRMETIRAMHRPAQAPAILEDLVTDLLYYLAAESSGQRRPYVFVPRPLVNYMVRPDSMINTIDADQIESIRRTLVEVRALYVEEGASRHLLEALDTLAFVHLGISMSFRLSYDGDVDLASTMDETTGFLDESFPLWRTSPYVEAGYAMRHGTSYRRIHVACLAWKAHLMPALLSGYRLAIERTGRDIKW